MSRFDLVYCFIFFLNLSDLFGQRTKSDSLELAEGFLTSGYNFTGSYERDSAFLNLQRAARIFKELGDRRGYLDTENRLAFAYLRFGDYSKALEESTKLLDIIDKAKYPRLKIEAFRTKSLSYYELREFDNALKYIDIVINLAKETNPDELPRSYNVKGLILKDIGNYHMALEYLQQVINVSAPDQLETNLIANVYNNMSLSYSRLGDFENAMYHQQKAVRLRKKIWGEESVQVGASYTNIGLIYSHLLIADSSVVYFKKAYKTVKASVGLKHPYCNLILHNLSAGYLKLNLLDSARKYSLKVLDALLQKDGSRGSLILEYKLLGDISFSSGDTEEAENFYKYSIALNFVRGSEEKDFHNAFDKVALVNIYEKLALVYERYFDKEKDIEYLWSALRYFRKCDDLVKIISRSSMNPLDKTGSDIDYANIYGAAIGVCKKGYEYSKQEVFLDEALFFSQRSKGNLLIQSISKARINTSGYLPAALVKLENEINQKEVNTLTKIDQILTANNIDSAMLQALWEENFVIKNTRDSLEEILQEDFPQYASLMLPQYKNYESLKINPEEAICIFTEGNEVFYLQILMAQKRYIFKIEDKFNLNELVEKILLDVSRPPKLDEDRSPRLHDFAMNANLLLECLFPDHVLDSMKLSGIKHLTILPDGPLHHLPFGLLVKSVVSDAERYAELDYLIKDFSLARYHSLAPITLANNQRIDSFDANYIGYAPTYNEATANDLRLSLTSLQWNQDEILHAAEVHDGVALIGDQATERAYKNQGSSRIIHLAMHAIMDDEDPFRSKLAFSKTYSDTLEDDFLNTYEIFNSSVHSELMVISGCETGLGKMFRGEGLLSLGYAFAYAGSPNLLLSQWRVDDYSTKELMKSFFESLLTESVPKALRQAQLKAMDNAVGHRDHPFFWAGFSYYGDNMKVNNAGSKMMHWVVFFMIVIGVAGFFLQNRKKN